MQLNQQFACPVHSDAMYTFHLANSPAIANAPVLYDLTGWGAIRWDLSVPGSPMPQLLQIGDIYGGRVPVPPDCHPPVPLSTIGAFEDGNGNGRIATDWQAICGVNGHGEALQVSGAQLSFGQQLEPADGSGISNGTPIQVVSVGASYFAFYGAGSNIYKVDLTSLTGHSSLPYVQGVSVAQWPLTVSLAAGTQTSTKFLFGVAKSTGGGAITSTLHAAAISSDGSLASDVSSAGFDGTGSVGVFFDGTFYWVFCLQDQTSTAPNGIKIFKFNPSNGSLTDPGWELQPPSGYVWTQMKVRGDVNPILFAMRRQGNDRGAIQGYDAIGTQFLPAGPPPAPGTIGTTLPYTQPYSDTWEVYVKASGAQTLAYLYTPVPDPNGGQPLLRVDTWDVSCAAASCSLPPIASLTVTNSSAVSRADKTNYFGDTFIVADTSLSCGDETDVEWDMNYAPPTFTADSNPGFPGGSPWSFPTVLPCDPNRPGAVLTSGYNCYDIAAPPASQNIANLPTNAHGTATSPGQQLVPLTRPLTEVSNLVNGTVQILSGGSVDAGPSQGDPTSFLWTAPPACTAAVTATCGNVVNGDTFTVSSRYRGGFVADPVTGTVVVVPLIAGFGMPPGAVQFGATFNVTNECQEGTGVSIVQIGDFIDTIPSNHAGTYNPLPASFDAIGATTQLTAPATVGTYYVHFRVSYTDGVNCTPSNPCSAYADPTLLVTDVVYTPSILISPAPTCFGAGCSEPASQPLSFSDHGDAGNPPTDAVWNFGDGSPTITSTTNQSVTHTYTSPGTSVTVHLTVNGGGETATFPLSITGPPPASCNPTISGLASITVGTAGTWGANTSGCSGTLAWTSSDGGSGTGPQYHHTFASAGTFTISDSIGGHSASFTVTATTGGCGSCGGGGPLTVTITGPSTIAAGTSGTWTAAVSGGGSATINWSILAGTFPIHTATGQSMTYSFTGAGSYTISALATAGGSSGSAGLPVTVTASGPPLPSTDFTISGATFNPVTGQYGAQVGDTVTFTATETTANPVYSWNFGSGQYTPPSAQSQTITHVFTAPGTFGIRLTVTNDNGTATSTARNVLISGIAFAGLVVPGAGHLQINDTSGNPIGAYETELSLVNNSAAALTVDFDFEPTTAGSINPSLITFNPAFRQVLPPHGGWYNADVTSGYLGGTGIGTLFLKYSGSTQAPSAVTRIYFSAGAGSPTYGTYLPAYPVNSSGQSLGAVSTSTQYLVGLQFAGFNPGLTLVASSPTGGNFNVNLFRDDATPVSATLPVSLAGYAQAKIPISTDCGTLPQCFSVSASDAATHTFYAEVTPQNTAAATPVIALASVVDDLTKDSMIISDDTPRLAAPPPGSNSTLFVPGVGKITANGANWKSDLYLLNPSQQAVSIIFTYFYSADSGPEQQAVAVQTIASGQEFVLRDVVASLFPSVAASGSTVLGQLRMDFQPGADGAPLIMEGRIANEQPAGSYGMQLPAYATTDGVLPSSGQITLAGLHNDTGTRTNFGFTAMSSGSDPVTVHAVAYSDADGSTLWTGDYTLNSGSFGHFVLQPTKGVAGFDALQNAEFSLVVTVTSGTGATPVAAFATVIDEQSSDPIFVPGKRPAQ